MLSSAAPHPKLRQARTVVMHEVYASVQGESSFVGLPCTFVRLSGCNLRCSWCDTPQAFHGGQRRDVTAVVAEALAHDTPLVEVTGGEPLLQAGAIDLLQAFVAAGRTTLLETSGERDISVVPNEVHRIVDFKAPGSGECARNRWENVAHLEARDEVKLVLADRADYDWAKDVLAEHQLHQRAGTVLLSPVHGTLDPRELVAWILTDKLPVRFQTQLHKYIWDPETEGV